MKFISFFILLFFSYTLSFAQIQGKIVSKEIAPQAGITNTYIYQPPKYLVIPNKIYASVVYENKQDEYYHKSIPINKVGGEYEFELKVPDSTQAIIMTVIDKKNKSVDDNNALGFISYLYGKKGIKNPSAYLQAAYMLSYFAPRMLDLDWGKLKNEMIKLYEKAYRLSPVLKKENIYAYYLTLLYQTRKDSVKSRLLSYAKQMASAKADERKWMNAIRIYRLLKLDRQQQLIEQKAIKTYPDGQVAKAKFLAGFYKKPGLDEQSILDAMHEYTNRFKDTTEQMKYTFYLTMIDLLISKQEWNRLPVYEPLMSDKITLANIYNSSASVYCGEQLDKPGKKMDIAKMLAMKSLVYVSDALKKLAPDDDAEYLQSTYNTYADTYALILYKLGQYDSAFYYQDVIYKQDDELGAGGLERYAVYSEKVKGAEYAKRVIEKQLLGGVNSPAMQEQLKSIYKKLNLPEDEFNKLREKTDLLSRQKTEETIKSKFGTTTAKDFTLKDIKGQNISLSSLKNKVVVLDFWATWCAPCRASFPAMQEIMNKYKDDTEVVFLFIDVWEHTTPNKMSETAAKFIKDNKYSFDVLLDTNDQVVNDYKVEYIPAKFVIDKKGNIVFMGNEINDLGLIIEDEKNKPI